MLVLLMERRMSQMQNDSRLIDVSLVLFLSTDTHICMALVGSFSKVWFIIATA